MSSLILYLGLMLIGYVIANRLHLHPEKFHFLSKFMMLTVYILLLLMGIRMGINEQITSNLGSIGIKALCIAAACLIGSVGFIFFLRIPFHIDRFGNVKKDITADTVSRSDAHAGSTDHSQLGSTVFILFLVAVGMLSGKFLIAKYLSDYLNVIDSTIGTALHYLLCVMVAVVGFDLGLSGGIVESIRLAGIKILLFPLAAILGTLIFGGICGLFLGLSLRDGLVISAGFGWYSYAPNVILSAGEEHIITSAIAFMYNVIRETLGIILIPVVAKKIGYIEATSLPGVSATDICLPMIERYCRPDTVVYSFITGIMMCFAASIVVPLLMSI